MMIDFDTISDMLLENLRNFFFPNKWMDLDLKFSKSELFTMLFIDKRKEITMSELAQFIHSPMSTTTGIVDRLVKQNAIRRDRSETDRRIVVLHLTNKGSEIIRDLKDLITQYLNVIMEGLSDTEQQYLIKIILKVFNRLTTQINSSNNKSFNEENTIKKIKID